MYQLSQEDVGESCRNYLESVDEMGSGTGPILFFLSSFIGDKDSFPRRWVLRSSSSARFRSLLHLFPLMAQTKHCLREELCYVQICGSLRGKGNVQLLWSPITHTSFTNLNQELPVY
jgi:hypothetical protein